MEWINVNRFIKDLSQKDQKNVPEHIAHMMKAGYFQKENSSDKEKIIDIPMVVVMNEAPVSASNDLGFNVISAFNLAENGMKINSKENLTPIYVYPKARPHSTSDNNTTGIEENQYYCDIRDGQNMNKSLDLDDENETFRSNGVFNPLIAEFMSLSRFGFKVYDGYNKEEITVRALWLYSVGDILTISDLMGGRYPENLRCCLRCNVFKSPLTFPANPSVKEGRGIFNFSQQTHGTLKSRNDGIFLNYYMNLDEADGKYISNDYYHSVIEPNFKLNGEISNKKYASKKQCNDLCENENVTHSTFYGFKIRSPMFEYKYFSLPWSLPPDIMHVQFINILKLMLSIILDPNSEAVHGSKNIDLSQFRFNSEQRKAYYKFLKHLNYNTPQEFKDNMFDINILSSKTFGLRSAAQREALLKVFYVLKDVIPKEKDGKLDHLLDIYSQMSVLMSYNNSTDLCDDVDINDLEQSWEMVINAFELIVTNFYTENTFIGTLPLHTMLHSAGYLKRSGTLRKFSSYATERLVKTVKSAQQNSRHPISSLCNYMIKVYLIKVVFASFELSKTLMPATKLSSEIVEYSTRENNSNLQFLARQLVLNYGEYTFGTDLAVVTKKGLTLLPDKGHGIEIELEKPETYYYRWFTRIKHNTSNYTMDAKKPFTDTDWDTAKPRKIRNIVRIVPSKTGSSSISSYAKLIACYSIRRPTVKKANYFAIVDIIEDLKSVTPTIDLLTFGTDVILGKYWIGKPKVKRRVVPVEQINNPVFVLPYINFEVAKGEFQDRFYIVDPYTFCEFTKDSQKKVELSIYRDHRNVNKEELKYLREQLGDRADEYIYRWVNGSI
ncbi:uncharacterized protein SAPINGB_P001982 [Magnusiomyces paraingens]|uniref:Uncharacterized protein n=1 Tax=Magnusiomyces paraingens TaxID=2606893 RepID=A0A5E8BDS2_9ASCO|nr:uncharacterized protein SAPINGB_P001982 [Saprochaete ingens]VVT48850.1 unnamed protein product [Saprochaete ingens]